MMQFVFAQSDLPDSWQATLINTPKPLSSPGSSRNPSTADTVKEFLSQRQRPESGVYLAVSSQPFVARQTLTVRQCLPHTFTIVGTGYSAPATLPLKLFLDEIARRLQLELSMQSKDQRNI